MDASNQAAQFGAGAQNTASLANQSALNARDQFNAGLGQDMNMANLSAGNRAAEFGAGAFNQAAGQNAAAANSRQEFNAGLLQSAGQFNAGQMADAARFGADARNTASNTNATLAQQAALANAGNFLQNNSQNLQAAGLLGNMGQQQQGMNLNAVNALNAFGSQAQQLDQASLDRLYQQYLLQQQYGQNQIAQTQGLLGTIPALYAGASSQGVQTNSPSVAQVVGTALQTAAMFSDVRLKTDIEPIGKRGEHNWYRYRYVWDEPGTVREGVMAQEVMHTGAVSVHPSGYLQVNYGAL
jgi:hypothetical protein